MGQFKETWLDICRVLDEVAPGWHNVKGKSAAECAVEAIRKLAMRQSDRSRDEIAETEREGAGRKGMNTQLKDPAESIMDMIGQLAGLPREEALARVREVVAKHEQAPQASEAVRDSGIAASVDQLVTAAKGMTKLYPHVWDRTDGSLVVFPEDVAQFDAAFDALRVALGEAVEDDDSAALTAQPAAPHSDLERARQGLPPYNPSMPTEQDWQRITENGRKAWGGAQPAACARPAPDIRPAVVMALANNLRTNGYELAARTMEDLLARVQLLEAAPAASAEPVAWAAVHFGGRRDGNIYATCDTREQIEAYIQDVHRSSDSLTLRARPLAFADAPVAAQAPAAAGDALDAARYRWLRVRWGRIADTYDGDSNRLVEIREADDRFEGWDVSPESLDAAIDAALQRTSGGDHE